MKQQSLFLALIATFTSVLLTACDKNDDDYTNNPPPVINAQVFSAAGSVADITGKLNEFKNTLGSTLNTAPGATGGRREVNWDGVPANLTNVGGFPFDFFGSADPALGNGRKRGLIMTTTGANFRMDSTDFVEIDASYADQFNAFSVKRIFVDLNSTVTTCTFKVPGTATDAFVKGFGVIFSDVDNANSTTVEFFNGTKSLGVYKAPVSNGQFSLLGVFFPDEKITKLKITSGSAVLAAGVKDVSTAGGTQDLVAMDDFLYDEPKTIQ
jgi:hypothetical protein